MKWLRRFHARGVFWRQLLRWGVLNVPYWLEPYLLGLWTFFFVAFWRAGRRGVMYNVAAILPGSSWIVNFFRAYRVFWNFAWTVDDKVRFKELRVVPDWEFSGREHFESLQAEPGGAIILTAHMGNYDLGAHLFATLSARQIVMVRAPEVDPETHHFESELDDRTGADALKVGFNTGAGALAFDLLHALQRGEIIAIQGDRVTPGIASLPASLFGRSTSVPAGPFALSMAARVPVYPLFIVRLGRRRYRLVVGAPFEVKRMRDRGQAFAQAVEHWTLELERVLRIGWFQWFHFEPFSSDEARS